MMPAGPASPLAQLVARFGTDLIVTERSALEAVSIDQHRRHRGVPLALALPRTVADVTSLLAFCNAARIGVVPQGGNTGYCAAATPDASGSQLVLSLRRLDKIRDVDVANGSLIAEAGCVLADVQKSAAAAGRFFPLSLGSEGSCTIGGNLSTNAGGLNVLRYGMMRELTLGLEVVLADGRVLSTLQALRKDNTGYDLKQLFVGAEGTLGIITAAALKLFPAPRAAGTAFVAVPSPAAAVALLARLRDGLGELVNSFELLPNVALRLLGRHLPALRQPLPTDSPWFVLCEASSADAHDPLTEKLGRLLEAAIDAGEVTDAALAQSERERREFWELRENVPEAQRRAGPSVKHDVSLPIGRIADFIAEASTWITAHVEGSVLVCYGHLGDGNLHFNISGANETATIDAHAEAMKRTVHDMVAARGGSFSAEHGIGQTKVGELARYASPLELELMRNVKKMFDPNGIMNPGKVLA